MDRPETILVGSAECGAFFLVSFYLGIELLAAQRKSDVGEKKLYSFSLVTQIRIVRLFKINSICINDILDFSQVFIARSST